MKLIYFVSLLFCCSGVGSRKLEFVQGISRHGDRAPVTHPYPNDPYGEWAWPRGWAQLTSLGMRQTRELGAFCRHRYNHFINASFKVEEFYMRSSDKERALVSAQGFLRGFYPATGTNQWEQGEHWQPIPVHAATPGDDDLLCHSSSMKCPNADAVVHQQAEKDWKTYREKYSDVFHLLAEVTGVTSLNYAIVDNVYNIHRELIHNLTDLQPDWVFKKYSHHGNRSTMEIITELRKIRLFNEYASEEVAQYYGGYLLNQWIETALAVAEQRQTKPRKMIWYSAHDTIQMSLMSLLGVMNDRMPPYASAFIMEIYSEDSQYFVEVFFRNNTDVDPTSIPIPLCGSPCSVADLARNHAHKVLKTKREVKEMCGLVSSPTTNLEMFSHIRIYALPFLLAICLLIAIWKCLRS